MTMPPDYDDTLWKVRLTELAADTERYVLERAAAKGWTLPATALDALVWLAVFSIILEAGPSEEGAFSVSVSAPVLLARMDQLRKTPVECGDDWPFRRAEMRVAFDAATLDALVAAVAGFRVLTPAQAAAPFN